MCVGVVLNDFCGHCLLIALLSSLLSSYIFFFLSSFSLLSFNLGQAMFVGSKGGNMGDRLSHLSPTETSSAKQGGGGGGVRAVTPTAGDR